MEKRVYGKVSSDPAFRKVGCVIVMWNKQSHIPLSPSFSLHWLKLTRSPRIRKCVGNRPNWGPEQGGWNADLELKESNCHHFFLLIDIFFCVWLLFKKNYFVYLFLAVLSLCCCMGLFFSCGKQGLLSSCGEQPSHCGGFSCCRAQTLEYMGFSSCGM